MFFSNLLENRVLIWYKASCSVSLILEPEKSQIMPNMHLTDLSVRSLRGSDRYITYWDTHTRGFGVRVGKRSKTWIVMRGRHRERVSIGPYGSLTLADARREAMRLLSEVKELPVVKPPSKTIKQAREEFVAEHYIGLKSRWPRIVKLSLEKHLKPIENKQLVRFGDEDIEALLRGLRKKPSAQLHLYRSLHTFLKWCTRPPRRYLKHSPMEGYLPPGKDRKGSRILSDDELVKVWNACGHGTRKIVRLMILWGTRNTETCSVRRSWCVDNRLTIPGGNTKNGRDHGIPLLPLAKEILEAQPDAGDCYFPGRKGDTPINSYALNRLLRDLHDETGTSGWQLRDLRRTFRSNMARLKVPRDICEVLINHAPPVLDEIYDRYDRLEEKREALGRYEAFLENLLADQTSE